MIHATNNLIWVNFLFYRFYFIKGIKEDYGDIKCYILILFYILLGRNLGIRFYEKLFLETIYKNSNLTVVHVKFLEGLHNSQKPTKTTLGNSEKWAHMGPTKKPWRENDKITLMLISLRTWKAVLVRFFCFRIFPVENATRINDAQHTFCCQGTSK